MANSVDSDQTAPIGAVCSGSTLFASILDLSVMLGNYLQQTTSADDIFRYIFFLALIAHIAHIPWVFNKKTNIISHITIHDNQNCLCQFLGIRPQMYIEDLL